MAGKGIYMFIVGKEQKLTHNEAMENAYRDAHNNHDLYLERILRRSIAEFTEYSFNARQFKTRKAAEKALELDTMWTGKKLKDLGFEVIEI